VLDEAAPQLDTAGGLVESETLERFGLTAVLPPTAASGLATRLLRGRGDSAAEPTEVVYGDGGRRIADAPLAPESSWPDEQAPAARRPGRLTLRDLTADFPG